MRLGHELFELRHLPIIVNLFVDILIIGSSHLSVTEHIVVHIGIVNEVKRLLHGLLLAVKYFKVGLFIQRIRGQGIGVELFESVTSPINLREQGF